MTYKEALDYIHSIDWRGSRPGLSRITELMERLGNPQDKLRFIHVAGTNGKGSVCAMISSILRAQGYRVGLFTSPYIRYFNERMSVDGVPIPDEELAFCTGFVRDFAETMEDPPTEFELMTAVGMVYFLRQNCDVVVLETGLGGKWDSTNVIGPPLLSVITGIDYDHMGILGNTLEEIASEKAGIIKKGSPVVFGQGAKEAERVIRSKALEEKSPFFPVDYSALSGISGDINGSRFDFAGYRGLFLPLLGSYQPFNAATAITAAEVLRGTGFSLSEEAVREGLKQVKWPGRFELIISDPVVIYDGGHNRQGVTACKESIDRLFPSRKVDILTGVMADKAYEEMAAIMAPVVEKAFTVTPENPRSLPAEELAEVYRTLGAQAEGFPSVEQGVQAALADAERSGRPLIAMGSLYLYREFMEAVEHWKDCRPSGGKETV